jgi:hypothetical protein
MSAEKEGASMLREPDDPAITAVAWESVPREDRILSLYPEPLVLGSEVEAPWISWGGACLIKVYTVGRDAEGSVWFGIGNEVPPVVAWCQREDFYGEWPQ